VSVIELVVDVVEIAVDGRDEAELKLDELRWSEKIISVLKLCQNPCIEHLLGGNHARLYPECKAQHRAVPF